MAVPDPTLRASDADRDRIQAQLDTHVGEGRLTLDEYEQRLGELLAARTVGDLRPFLRELPALPQAPASPQAPAPRRGRRQQVVAATYGWLAMAVMFVAIWGLTGAGYFWPIWPIMGTVGMIAGGGKHHHRRHYRHRATWA
jgi:Domain of unknown function (DUF1707)